MVTRQFQNYFWKQIPDLPTEEVESAQKMEISFQGLHSKTRKYNDLNSFITRNHSISTTKGTAQGLIQRYKVCYSQRGVTVIAIN